LGKENINKNVQICTFKQKYFFNPGVVVLKQQSLSLAIATIYIPTGFYKNIFWANAFSFFLGLHHKNNAY
jgi:hypothetical protein